MSEASVQMAYEGDAVATHMMEVNDLAPALLAIGDLCKNSNRVINGDKVSVKVFVKSDFENKCFQIDFQVLQTLYGQVMELLQDARITSAKELLEWIGILGGLPTVSLLAYLKLRRGRKVESIKKIDTGNVEVTFEGDNNSVTINQIVLDLSEDNKVIKAVKEVIKPTQIDGIDSVEFRDKKQVYEKITQSEAVDIISMGSVTGEEDILEPQIIEARLVIHSPVFDEKSEIWRFKYGKDIIRVDISDTTIAHDTLVKGQVYIGDTYKVKLEISERETEAGNFVNDYKIVEVLGFTQGPQQQSLQFGKDDES